MILVHLELGLTKRDIVKELQNLVGQNHHHHTRMLIVYDSAKPWNMFGHKVFKNALLQYLRIATTSC